MFKRFNISSELSVVYVRQAEPEAVGAYSMRLPLVVHHRYDLEVAEGTHYSVRREIAAVVEKQRIYRAYGEARPKRR